MRDNSDHIADHFLLVTLETPQTLPKPIRTAIIATQELIQKMVDLLGAGHPLQAIELHDLLQRDLIGSGIDAAIKDPLVISTQTIAKVRADLADISHRMTTAAFDISGQVQQAKDDIARLIDALNADIRSSVKTFSPTTTAPIYFPTPPWDRVAAIKLMSRLGATVDAVEHRIKSVSDFVAQTTKDLAGGSTNSYTKSVVDTVTKNVSETVAKMDTPTEYDRGYRAGIDSTGGSRPGTPPPASDLLPGTSDDILDQLGLNGGPSAGDGGGVSGPSEQALNQILSRLGPMLSSGQSNANTTDGMNAMMQQLMMSQMAQQMQKAQQQKRLRSHEDPKPHDDRQSEPIATPQDQAPPNTPAAPVPGTAPTATPDSPPPPAEPAAEPAPATPVELKLPDGSTQASTSIVAEAVNRELNNPNGSDAHAAYAGTSGAPTATQPWVPADPADPLHTGDIVQWENRSALVVVQDDGLHVIASGRLVRLDPNNPVEDGHGPYGAFQGFFHPTGVDGADPKQQAPTAPNTITVGDRTTANPPDANT